MTFRIDQKSTSYRKIIQQQSVSNGFTLIELMIVVAIIAIILTLALPVYSDYAIRAKIGEALSVGNSAKTAVSTACQETPNIPAITDENMGYEFDGSSKWVASVTLSGPCTNPVINIQTHQLGANPDPLLTLTGELLDGHMSFTCTTNGENRHVPETCRS